MLSATTIHFSSFAELHLPICIFTAGLKPTCGSIKTREPRWRSSLAFRDCWFVGLDVYALVSEGFYEGRDSTSIASSCWKGQAAVADSGLLRLVRTSLGSGCRWTRLEGGGGTKCAPAAWRYRPMTTKTLHPSAERAEEAGKKNAPLDADEFDCFDVRLRLETEI